MTFGHEMFVVLIFSDQLGLFFDSHQVFEMKSARSFVVFQCGFSWEDNPSTNLVGTETMEMKSKKELETERGL